MRKLTLAAAATALCIVASPRSAKAEENVSTVPPTGKGIVGGALLGGEVVMLTEAAFKVKPWWAYALGGVAGGVAGGVGGYFLEQSVDDGKIPMYLLTGGMALAIPTTVAVLSASRYEPPAHYTEDRGPTDEPVAEPAQPDAAPAPAPAPTSRRKPMRQTEEAPKLPPAPPALVGLSEQALTLSVPAVQVRDLYTREDMFRYGISQKTEVRVPVLNYTF